MTLPHSWGVFELQRDIDQARLQAAPAATDTRFKFGGLFLLLGWLVVVTSLHNSTKHDKLPACKFSRSGLGYFKSVPLKSVLALSLSLVVISYETACAFDFSLSPLNVKANVAWIYGLGWVPIALIICIFEIAGYCEPNEDDELIRQRRCQEAEMKRETRDINNEELGTRSRQMAPQADGTRHIASLKHISRVMESDRGVEFKNISFPGREEHAINTNQNSQQATSSFPDPYHTSNDARESSTNRPHDLQDRTSRSGDTLGESIPSGRGGENNRSSSVASSVTAIQTQHVRSMLDI